ncbi:hypothetical protein VTO73DRAFT_7647 [Trametes versicolor]
MRFAVVLAALFATLAYAAPTEQQAATAKGPDDDGVGWFVASPALMKAAPAIIKSKFESEVSVAWRHPLFT